MQNEVSRFLKKDWDTVIKAVNALPEKYSKITYEDVERLRWFVDTVVLDHYGPFFDEELTNKARRRMIEDNYDGAVISSLDGIEV
jgi:hypothetical protein|tara:strand:- start:33 stop:287 length:255 start_codon:yes stop_codon:yes gene_type:complete